MQDEQNKTDQTLEDIARKAVGETYAGLVGFSKSQQAIVWTKIIHKAARALFKLIDNTEPDTEE